MRKSTQKYLEHLNRIDLLGMMSVYLMHALLSAVFVFVMWDESIAFERGLGFRVFYSFGCGISIALCLILLRASAMNRRMMSTRVTLLLAAVLQGVTLLADLLHSILYGGFFADGYIRLAVEGLLVAMYLRRMRVLSLMEKLILDDLEYELRGMARGKE